MALLMAALALSGCATFADPDPAEQAASTTLPSRPPVVAIIDSGINPYHQVFSTPNTIDPSAWGIPANMFSLATDGAFNARVDADRSEWDALAPGELVYFPGTRVFGISFREEPKPLVLDDAGHGTGVASLVARDSPSSLIVVIQVDGRLCEGTNCLGSQTLATAMEWAATQPWIDVISLSFGTPGNPPEPGEVNPVAQRFAEASRLAHDSGKIVVAAGGNSVTPGWFSYVSGPPWVINVGGSQPRSSGEALVAARGPDVVANATEYVARYDGVTATDWNTGTSFAAPIVAATLAEALGIARSMGGSAEEKSTLRTDLRSALNASAIYVHATNWDPRGIPSNESLIGPHSASVPYLLPPAQTGWGIVHAGLAPEIATRATGHDFSLQGEWKGLAAQHQAAVHRLRAQAWQE